MIVTSALFTMFLAACGNFQIINTTKFPWNKHDEKILSLAKQRCTERYNGCLSFFIKKGAKDYAVFCSRKQDEDK